MSFLIYNAIFLFIRVAMGSFEHIVPILLAILFCVLFIRYANRKLNESQQHSMLHFFALFICLTVVAFHIYKISLGNYSIKTDLPLFLCSFLGLIIPVFTYYRKLWMYEILLFWIIAGTTQAILTPDISEGFPSFNFFRYWLVHLGIIIIMLYATFVFKMKPIFKSIFKSFFALQLYVIFMVILNFILNANYSYLNRKPESASVLDYLGEWPFYIIVVQLILIPYFLLIYLPFYIVEKKRKKSLSK
ncbi:conserved hypothetical integral membrane protein TIGR02206 [Flaviramulus basaltis]|uniref:Conserved hypothetical integral membrane protein TIGR02206 n=1 Tax=Flaviramulus basaltis TaxID=369401 RepID=A0A1K2I9Z1_9FLAO|nr:TIGR02206 family membrane protein [Flaviramulus basaltis]SFZ89215.1 conserved hypothetical integral membrane protein TIGR02206 [Flaviramulus basaltis]